MPFSGAAAVVPLLFCPYGSFSAPAPIAPRPKFHLAPIWKAVSFGLATPVAAVPGRRPSCASYPAPTVRGPRAHTRLPDHDFGFGKPLAIAALPGEVPGDW